MYQGRFDNQTNVAENTKRRNVRTRRRKISKQFVMLLSILLLVSIVGGATIAYLISDTNAVTNSFVPGEVKCEVSSDGTVTNTGNVDAYVRVAVVTSLQNEAGEMYAYATIFQNLDIVTNEGWSRHNDGYFYYGDPIAPGKSTPALGTMTFKGLDGFEIPDGYDFVADIFAEAIQADGRTGTWGEEPTSPTN